MLAASMEAPSYGASRLPFTIRHRPTLYVTKFASCGWVSISWRQRGGRCDPDPAPEMIEWDAVCWVKSRHRSATAQCPLYPQKRTLPTFGLSLTWSTPAQNQRPRSRHATATTIRAATSMMRTNKLEESMRFAKSY